MVTIKVIYLFLLDKCHVLVFFKCCVIMLYSFWVKIVFVLLGGQFLQQVDWLSEVFQFLTVARNCLSWRGTLVSSRVWALAFWFLAGWEWLCSQFSGLSASWNVQESSDSSWPWLLCKKEIQDGDRPLIIEWLVHWIALVLLNMTGGVCGWLLGSNEKKIQVLHFNKRKGGTTWSNVRCSRWYHCLTHHLHFTPCSWGGFWVGLPIS